MAKSKKFNAAEKHFIDKELRYQKQLKRLGDTIAKLSGKNLQLIAEKVELETENTRLNEWIERLLEYTELSKEDIKAVCEQDKRHERAVSSIMHMLDFTTKY